MDSAPVILRCRISSAGSSSLTEALNGSGCNVVDFAASGPVPATDAAPSLVIVEATPEELHRLEWLRTFRATDRTTPILLATPGRTHLAADKISRLRAFVLLDGAMDPEVAAAFLRDMLASPPRPARPPVKILVADPTDADRKWLEYLLVAAGYDVETAVDGPAAARRLLAPPSCDLALLALDLPGRGGAEVLAEAKLAKMPTILNLIAGDASPEEISRGYAAGAHTLMRKPFDLRTMMRFFDMTEHECADRKMIRSWQAEEQNQPFLRKAYRRYLDAHHAPPESFDRRLVVGIELVIIGIIVALVGLWLVKTLVPNTGPEYPFDPADERIQESSLKHLLEEDPEAH